MKAGVDAVVVTGCGAVSACGWGAELLWRGALAGSGTAGFLPFEPPGGGPGRPAGCAVPGDGAQGTRFRAVRRMPRVMRLAAGAAAEAWDAAAFSDAAPGLERTAVVVGTSRAVFEATLDTARRLNEGSVLPSLAAAGTVAGISGVVAAVLGAGGPNLTVSSACVSGASAIALAADWIRLGRADVAVAGGAEAALHPVILAQMAAADLLGSGNDPSRRCRPYQPDRDGTVPGEGAGFVVLESAAHAARRGARVLARLTGWSLACEAGARAGMSRSGGTQRRVMEEALAQAGLGPDAVGYVNTHGTGTRLNDAAEASALADCFGPRGVPVSSTKPVTGHCLGASPALEAVLCVKVLNERRLPPQGPGGGCDAALGLRCVAAGETLDRDAVMSVSSGFWGNAGALVFEGAPARGIIDA